MTMNKFKFKFASSFKPITFLKNKGFDLWVPRLALTLLCSVFTQGAVAQESDQNSQTNTWALSTGTGNTESVTGRATENFITLRRYSSLGSIAIERIQLKRFGLTDTAVALDAYPRLWSGAYANLRYQTSSASSLYPKQSWRAEVYQNAGGGWEWAAGHDYLGFASDVKIDGVAIGHYWGNFYARLRHQRVVSNHSSGSGDRFMLRYYYQGDADHYLEINASKGRSDDFSTAQIAGNRSDSRGLAWYHFIDKNWGFKLSASQANDTSGFSQTERSLNAGISYRW